MGCGASTMVDTFREQDTVLYMLHTGFFNVFPENTGATSDSVDTGYLGT